MAELPFTLGRKTKWISGIQDTTTCKDILISLLHAEGVSVDEEEIERNFALVEKWRQVEKVLKSTSLILKIWQAWGEEQDNVNFIVKRIKRREAIEVATSQDGNSLRTPARSKRGSRPAKGQRPSSAADTLHPRALVRSSRNKVCYDLELLMRKIIQQGEEVKAHLLQLQDSGYSGERQKLENLLKDINHLSSSNSPLSSLLIGQEDAAANGPKGSASMASTRLGRLVEDDLHGELSNDSGVGGEEGELKEKPVEESSSPDISGELSDLTGLLSSDTSMDREDVILINSRPASRSASLGRSSSAGKGKPLPSGESRLPTTKGLPSDCYDGTSLEHPVSGTGPKPVNQDADRIAGPVNGRLLPQVPQIIQMSGGRQLPKLPPPAQHYQPQATRPGLTMSQASVNPVRGQSTLSGTSSMKTTYLNGASTNLSTTSDTVVASRPQTETMATSSVSNSVSPGETRLMASMQSSTIRPGSPSTASVGSTSTSASQQDNISLSQAPSSTPPLPQLSPDIDLADHQDYSNGKLSISKSWPDQPPGRGSVAPDFSRPRTAHVLNPNIPAGRGYLRPPPPPFPQPPAASTKQRPRPPSSSFFPVGSQSPQLALPPEARGVTSSSSSESTSSSSSTASCTSDYFSGEDPQHQHQQQLQLKGQQQPSSEEGASLPLLLPPPNNPEFYEWVETLEKLHRLNALLETKEEQALALQYEFQVMQKADQPELSEQSPNPGQPDKTQTEVTTGRESEPGPDSPQEAGETRYSTPPPCFNLEVAKYRDINARLTAEIGRNRELMDRLAITAAGRRKLANQLEFDVNMVEREGKRLESDLNRLEALGLEVLQMGANGGPAEQEENIKVEKQPKSVRFCDPTEEPVENCVEQVATPTSTGSAKKESKGSGGVISAIVKRLSNGNSNNSDANNNNNEVAVDAVASNAMDNTNEQLAANLSMEDDNQRKPVAAGSGNINGDRSINPSLSPAAGEGFAGGPIGGNDKFQQPKSILKSTSPLTASGQPPRGSGLTDDTSASSEARLSSANCGLSASTAASTASTASSSSSLGSSSSEEGSYTLTTLV